MAEPHAARQSPVRAVVVDDEPAARDVIVTLLADYAEVAVVGEATNGREAVDLIRRERPDLLFLDIQMPDQDGFGVLESLAPTSRAASSSSRHTTSTRFEHSMSTRSITSLSRSVAHASAPR
jgi:two-component system LytT family response regulator